MPQRHDGFVCLTRGCGPAVVCFALLAFGLAVGASAPSANLRDQLTELARLQGFEIQGLHRVGPEPAQSVTGEVRYQLKRMLSGYNYVVIDDTTGSIRKLIIVARGMDRALPPEQPAVQAAATPGEHIIPLQRRGTHQIVQALLVGPGQVPQPVSLIVDTGASTLVLPKSMIYSLGFDVDALHDGWTQTANGKVRAKVGRLHSVAVGSATAENVMVTFLEDVQLNGVKLLGMSFLQRFRMTIDDANSRIILTGE